MGLQLSKQVTANAVYGPATTTAATFYSDKVDVSGAQGVLFTALFRSTAGSTGTCAFTVVGSNTGTAASTSYTALTGASVTVAASTTAATKRICGIDSCNPQYQYLKAKFVKQAGIIFNGCIAQKYGLASEPAAASTTYAGATAAASFDLVIGAT